MGKVKLNGAGGMMTRLFGFGVNDELYLGHTKPISFSYHLEMTD
jgi:hypothetical protein